MSENEKKVPCPKCKTLVPKGTEQCPKCGEPVKAYYVYKEMKEKLNKKQYWQKMRGGVTT